jgi:hypothetical protein
MKSFLLIFGALLMASISYARPVHYQCTSYQNRSETVTLDLESTTLAVKFDYKGQIIEGRSTDKVKPNIHLPFTSDSGQELELYLDVKSKVLSVRTLEGVVFQAYCF